MANVSSSNGLENRPKLRFPGFDEPWKMLKAEELFQNITDKKHENEIVLTIVQGKGTLPREKSGRNIHYDNASLTSYKKVEKGDFIIHLRSFEGGLEMANGRGIVSPAYTILRCIKPHSSLFYESYFHTDEFINHVLAKAVEGIRDGRQISYDAFKWLSIPYCSVNEQVKISNLFDILNKRIQKQRSLVEALKKYKRGLSDALFEVIAKNQNVNEYRFEDIMELLQNNTFSRDELILEGDGIKNIHYGDILIKYGASIDIHKDKIPVIKSDISVKKYSFKSYLKNGDVVFADTAEDYAVGKATEIVNAEGHQILSGLHTIPCRPKKHFAPMFLGYYFNSSLYRTQIYPIVQGTKVSSISKSEIVKTKIIVPPELMQKQIASILYAIDIRIDAAEKQKEAFDNLRYGLLQQLFI